MKSLSSHSSLGPLKTVGVLPGSGLRIKRHFNPSDKNAKDLYFNKLQVTQDIIEQAHNKSDTAQLIITSFHLFTSYS